VRQHVEAEHSGAVARGQAGQLAAAGDDDQAGGAGRQQRPDLLLIAGIVQDDQHLAVGQHAAVHARLGLGKRRDALCRNAERVEETADRLAGGGGDAGGVEAAQVDIQLPVAESAGDLVGPVHGQRGLAHARGPADRADHDRARRASSGIVQDPGQHGELGGPAGEAHHCRGQLSRHRRRPARRAGQGAAVSQQLLDPVRRDP
jgi:hypothetical protein